MRDIGRQGNDKMSSILTNTSAMVALQTLRTISSNLGKTQNDISTGKSVSNAKENSAVWSISKVMESDVMGFKGISDSLALGASTIAVAASAAERVTDLLNEMKQKIVASQEENVDRSKIQTDISSLRDLINGIVGAAQFNGLNMLSNRHTFAAAPTAADLIAQKGVSGQVNILASLDRSSNGSIKASYVAAARGDLGSQAAVTGGGAALAAAAFTGTGSIAIGASALHTVVGDTTTTGRTGHPILGGDGYAITGLTGLTGPIVYVARDGDTLTDVAKALVARITFEATKADVKITAELEGTSGIRITNNTAAAVTTVFAGTSGGTAGGALNLMSAIDVSTTTGAKAALGAIEGLTQTAIAAAAKFGTAQKRIVIQQGFITSLSDSLKAGIGSLIDADMEEASARLQALQVQQQLGIQALSIANQAPQNILSLFR